MAEKLQAELLQAIDQNGGVPDSGEFASAAGVDHNTLVGAIKSLLAYEMISAEVRYQRSAPCNDQPSPLATGSRQQSD